MTGQGRSTATAFPGLSQIARLAAWCARRLREQAARETQAELNRRLAALHPSAGLMRPAHICSPAWATAGPGHHDDPLEQLWRLPCARRPRRTR